MSILVRLASAGCPWQITALIRSLVPLILVAAWAKADGVRLVWWGPRTLWIRSIAGSCSMVGCFYAFAYLPTSEVCTLSSTFPIWVAILSWPLLRQVPSPPVWISALTGVLGVALVQHDGNGGVNWTALIVVAASMCTAVAMMGLHRLKHLDPRAIVVHFSAVASIFCLGAVVFVPDGQGPTEPFALRHVLMLAGMGLTATIGQFFLTKAFTTGAPSRVAVVGLTQVVMVFAIEASLLDLTPDGLKLLGVVLILAPAAWVMLHRRLRPARALPLEPEVPPPEPAPLPALAACEVRTNRPSIGVRSDLTPTKIRPSVNVSDRLIRSTLSADLPPRDRY
jgi:drug/metabolite transporter (DMT)-like permease